jgi:hypothetical protein
MHNDIFARILKKFLPHQERIEYVSLQGWGEPLLDKTLAGKIKTAKDLGFKGVGFATNCTELDEDVSKKLLEAGLDTILCGIDGIDKETHEGIRIGTNFERIVENVKRFIGLRNKTGKTRVVIRFIRQEQNKEQWEKYQEYWSKYINKDFGDEIIKFDIHNAAGSIEGYEAFDVNREIELGKFICDELWKRMVIFSDARVAFCNADINGFYDLGNLVDDDPIEIFNNETYRKIRTMMEEGKIMELEHCRVCTIPRSRFLKQE